MINEVTYLKAYTALTGSLVAASNNEEARELLEAIKNIQGYDYEPEAVIKKALKYCPDGTIQYVIVNTVMEDVHVSLVIGTAEIPVPEDLATEEGVFAYVYNVSYDYDSELGYIFLRKSESGSYRRIG